MEELILPTEPIPQQEFVNSWTAFLSNKEVVCEETPIPGEKTSWQKLLDRLRDTPDIKMVAVQIHDGFTTITSMIEKADGLCQCHEAIVRWHSGNKVEINLHGVGSVVGDVVYMCWIDQNGAIWQDIRPLADMKIHTTLRDS